MLFIWHVCNVLSRGPCVYLIVPATVVNNDVVDVVEVVENHTMYLVCPAQGVPPPSILWLRDDVPMMVDDEVDAMMTGKVREMSSGRQLELRHVTVQDEAVFQCRATNVAGQQSKRFQLRVLGELHNLSCLVTVYIHCLVE